jgi:hypothetical protein
MDSSNVHFWEDCQKSVVEKFRRKICLLQAFIQEKGPLKPLFK